MSEKIYVNGEVLELAQARVSALNPGLLQGVGLFETLRAYEGRPFWLDRHIARMEASAEKLRLPLNTVTALVPEAVRAVLDANNLAEARVRFTITPPDPFDVETRPTLIVSAQAVTGYPPEMYEKGMTVFICTDFRQSAQDPLAGHKTTSYFPRLVALRIAQERGCSEALWFTPNNLLAEGCISNVFLVKNGELRPPPLDTPVLPGIAREVVLEQAKALGIPASEAPCTINDLLDADEVFLTNSVMEVMPVTRVERKAIADEKPGPVTRRLLEAYRALTRGAEVE